MSLPSFYGGEPEDELAIWRDVINPAHVPEAEANDVAERESCSLSGSDYQTDQVAGDEKADDPANIERWDELTTARREAVLRLIEDLLQDQDSKD